VEATTLICDVCGKTAAQTVTIKVGEKNHLKDLCSQHVSELLKGTRAPRRGRPKVIAAGRPKRVASKSGRKSTNGRRKATRRATVKVTGARRGRPRKKAAAAAR
jgi:hypothetical protein